MTAIDIGDITEGIAELVMEEAIERGDGWIEFGGRDWRVAQVAGSRLTLTNVDGDSVDVRIAASVIR